MIKLRPYQKELAEECRKNLARYHICYLNMEVRTGKTFTALQAINYGAYRNVLFQSMTLEQALERIAELEKQLDKAQLTINTLLISASKKQ